MNCYIKLKLFFLLLPFIVFSNLFAQTYAPLPFFESFDQVWINGDNLRDIPSHFWKNTPSTGSNSWSRYDDGYKRGAWDSTFPYLLIEQGADSSKYSARIHTNSADQPGMLDLYANFSTLSGSKILSFWYLNVYGKDSLKILLSENGGSSFGAPLAIFRKTEYKWTQVFVDLGASTSPTVVVRFEGAPQESNDDICIDQVKLNGLSAEFEADKLSGMAPLTVNFSDLSLGSPSLWSWDFDNDGKVDATSQNPSFTYTKAGSYSVKLTITNNYSTDTVIKKIYIQVYEYASVPYYENFEKEWINCKSVHEVPSMNWKCDDDYWGRSDDASIKNWQDPTLGGGTYFESPFYYTARFHSVGTTWTGNLDLLVDLSSGKGKQLSFNYLNSYGEDSLKIYLSQDGGNSFGDTLRSLGTLSYIDSYGVRNGLMKVIINLGDAKSSTSVLRFKAIGAYNKSIDDIYIDEVKVGDFINDIHNLGSEVNVFKIVPNPSNDIVYIDFANSDTNENVPIEIIDLNGKIVISTYFNSYKSNGINIQKLTNGIYYIRAICKDKIYSCKLIKI